MRRRKETDSVRKEEMNPEIEKNQTQTPLTTRIVRDPKLVVETSFKNWCESVLEDCDEGEDVYVTVVDKDGRKFAVKNPCAINVSYGDTEGVEEEDSNLIEGIELKFFEPEE